MYVPGTVQPTYLRRRASSSRATIVAPTSTNRARETDAATRQLQNPLNSTYVMRLSSEGCLSGELEAAFRRNTTPLAVGSPSGGGALVLGLRNAGDEGSKLEAAMVCTDVE
jgi:hypothetical protein